MKISDWAAKRGIRVFHFTNESNVPLIVSRGGLFSWWHLEQTKQAIPVAGGTRASRRLDTARDLQDCVRLCFVDNHQMQYQATEDGRIPHPRYLKIHLTALDLPGTRFSDMNACDSEAHFGEGLEWFQKEIHWRLVVDKIGWHNGRGYNFKNRPPFFDPLKAKWQAEAMVPRHIPLSFIHV